MIASLTLCAVVWLGSTGCGGAGEHAQSPSPARSGAPPVTLLPMGNAPQFRFHGLDGREISSDIARGRNSVVAFLAAFDWASQAQARFVSGIEHSHRPRTNCFALVIERSEHVTLVDAFVSTLSLRYPVAHVPTEKLAKSAFRGIRTVPSVLVLDAGGNVVWKSRGLAMEETLDAVLTAVEERSGDRR